MAQTIFAVIVAFVVGGLIAWLAERSRTRGQLALLEKSSRDHFQQWTEASEHLHEARKEISEKDVTIARLEERSLAERQAFEEMKARLPVTFKSLASEILEEKSKAFAEQNQLSLGQLLDPLKTRLKDFQEKIEATHLEQAKGGAALAQQVSTLMAANATISKEANNLTLALRGSNKVQGDWGEVILEKTLENTGLRRGEEFDIQESHTLENGKRARPDVVIHLPENKHLVIDSKVSLTAYYDYCKATTDEERQAALTAHLKSIRAHIKELSEKSYQALYGPDSLNFVIMFLPVEPAMMLALSRDENLWESAWQSNVLMASPSTLLFVLRTVACLWQQERQQQNAQDIADRGAALYDKFAGFIDDMKRLGEKLGDVQKSYSGAVKKLHTGSGNLIRQVEMLRELGVKSKHDLPADFLELANAEDSQLEIGSSEIHDPASV